MIREILKTKDYLFKTFAPSKIDPTKEVLLKEDIRCPNCKIIRPLYRSTNEFGTRCECGLTFRVKGNNLHCTIEENKLILK